MNLTIAVAAEPKLKIIGENNEQWLQECVDEHDRPIAVAGRNSINGYGNGWWWQLAASFGEPPEGATKIGRLRGRLRFTVAVRSETIEIPDLMSAKNVSRSAGGYTVTLQEASGPANGSYQIKLATTGPRPITWNGGRPPFRVLDDQGRPLMSGGHSTSTNGQGRTDWTVSFNTWAPRGNNQPGAPAKLVWEVPVETKELEVPFELTDLPLP
jgi:hypothetical protein